MVAAQDQNILLIEDNPGDARLIREFFTEASPSEFRLHWADRLSKGLDRLDKGDIDLVLLDVSLPDSRGFNTFAQVQNRAPQVPIILITGNDDESLSLQAVRQGAQDFIVPMDPRWCDLRDTPSSVTALPSTKCRTACAKPSGGPTPGASSGF